MKRKLQDIIQEKFTYEETHLLLPDMNLNFTAIEKELFEGTFRFHSSGDSVRGIVTCENPRIVCLNPEFSGTDIQIRFQYQTDDLCEGNSDEGVFVITSTAGEYLFPFRANITRHYLTSSIGKIKTLNDFTNLCKLSWDEALTVFKSPYFPNVLYHDNGAARLLYRGLTEKSCSGREMEEFLIGCGKKKRSTITVGRKNRQYRAAGAIQTDLLDVEKSEWGYSKVEVSCDASFVRLEKHQLQPYDFVGKHAELQYQILPGELHAGKNFARIVIRTPFQEETVQLEVDGGKQKKQYTLQRQLRWIRAKMEKCYLDFRAEKLNAADWRSQMEALIAESEQLNPSNEWNALYRIFVCLTCGDTAGGDQLAAKLPKSIVSQRTALSAFYLYLTTIGQAPTYIRDVTRRVREIYLKYPSHPVLVWILLHMDETLIRNPERKYQWLKKYMAAGPASPIFYEEAARLLENHPNLLMHFDRFERRVFSWMQKSGRISQALYGRIFACAPMQKTFDPVYFRLLSAGSDRVSDANAVKTICTYLIKCSQYGEVYFPWFQRGVAQHLKLAGLYDAYLLSWNRGCGMLPDEILRYFSKKTALPAKRRAMLFAYVVKNRGSLGKDWAPYLVLVKNFARQELSQGHMNQDLADIYEAVREFLPAAEWNGMKGSSEKSYRIRSAAPGMTAVRVWQPHSNAAQRVLLSKDMAYVSLTELPFVILYEDGNGKLYANSEPVSMKKMLSGERLYQKTPEPSVEIKRTDLSEPSDAAALRASLEAFAAPMAAMEQKIKKAEQLGMEVPEYETKLLARMLFTGQFLPDHETLFDRLCAQEADPLVLDAYAVWFSYQCVRETEELSDPVRAYLKTGISSGRLRQPVCRIAFLKDFARYYEKENDALAEELLASCVWKGWSFAWYGLLPVRLQRKYLLFGQRGVDYLDLPGQILSVTLYREGRQLAKDVMTETLPGYYTFAAREILPEGVTYRIEDREGALLQEGDLPESDAQRWSDTRYGRLMALLQKNDPQTAYQYAELSDLTDILFGTIEE